jgi:hypothetical protein
LGGGEVCSSWDHPCVVPDCVEEEYAAFVVEHATDLSFDELAASSKVGHFVKQCQFVGYNDRVEDVCVDSKNLKTT